MGPADDKFERRIGQEREGALLTTTERELDPEGLEDKLDCLLNGEGWRAVEGPETEAIEERNADDGRGSLAGVDKGRAART